MSEDRTIYFTVLKSAFQDFDAPCCASESSLVVHTEDGGEIRQCFGSGCEKYFAVIDNQVNGQAMFVGSIITFVETPSCQNGHPLTLRIIKHPFDV